jgi:sugar diacid utilization regulator
LAQKNLVKGFFDDLMDGNADLEDSLRQRASFLGCDLSRPHAVVMIEIAHLGESKSDMPNTMSNMNGRLQKPPTSESLPLPEDEAYTSGATLQATYKRVRDMVRRRIQDSFPASLFYEYDNVLTCILSFSKDSAHVRLKTWLYDLARQVQSEYHVYLSIGIGNLCESISDYRRGFAEAREALQMGQNLHRDRDTGSSDTEMKTQSIVTHFNDLGVYRYLYKIAHMDDLRDMYQDQIEHIASYDRRKNTDLLMTLETYLECAGNLTKTSERLYVHRNTLIQRLERIQSLCKVDLQDRANWLTLQIAIKVYKLRIGSL